MRGVFVFEACCCLCFLGKEDRWWSEERWQLCSWLVGVLGGFRLRRECEDHWCAQRTFWRGFCLPACHHQGAHGRKCHRQWKIHLEHTNNGRLDSEGIRVTLLEGCRRNASALPLVSYINQLKKTASLVNLMGVKGMADINSTDTKNILYLRYSEKIEKK